jgi:hypothetical protein
MTILKCPKCNRKVRVWCLASYPAQYEAECPSCRLALRYYMRADSRAKITQEELSKMEGYDVKPS